MKIITAFLSIITIFFITGCTVKQEKPIETGDQLTKREVVTKVEDQLKVIYPNREEKLSKDESIEIRYSMGSKLKSRGFSEDEITELYLIRPDGVIEGSITENFDISSTSYMWDPQKLWRWAGIDSIPKPTRPGKYRVLFLIRSRQQDTGEGRDYPVDQFMDGFDKFENGKILVTREGKIIEIKDLIMSDVSDNLFEIE